MTRGLRAKAQASFTQIFKKENPMDYDTSQRILAQAVGSAHLQRSTKIPFGYWGKINGHGNGKPTAVLLATSEGDFIDYICNQRGLESIVASEDDGRVGAALVVHAKIAADGAIAEVGVTKAKEVLNRIREESPRSKGSARGPIWILSPAFFGLADDEPF
jgi:hypothetical protein